MRSLAAVLLLAACTPPATPPPAPERAEPVERPAVVATVTGTIHHSAMGEAGFASVTISRGDSDCRPREVIGRITADHRGRYSMDIPHANECVIVEAEAAGARGAASSLNRAGTPRERIELDVRLEPPAPLTRADAEAFVASLQRAVNDNDETAMNAIAPYFLVHDDEAIRAGVEHLRVALGDVIAANVVEERPGDYHFELIGSKGATSRLIVQQYGRRIASNPMMYYGSRAMRFLGMFQRLIATNDAEKLARLLTADDIDYPVDKARAVIARHPQLGEMESAHAVFTGIDERTGTLRYRIEGRRRDGTTASVPIELGYGDGLLWLRE